MATLQLPARRLIIAGGFVAAVAAAPAIAAFAMPTTGAPAHVSACPSGESEDTFTTVCTPDLVPNSPEKMTSPVGGLPEIDGIPCTGDNSGQCIGLSEEQQAEGPHGGPAFVGQFQPLAPARPQRSPSKGRCVFILAAWRSFLPPSGAPSRFRFSQRRFLSRPPSSRLRSSPRRGPPRRCPWRRAQPVRKKTASPQRVPLSWYRIRRRHSRPFPATRISPRSTGCRAPDVIRARASALQRKRRPKAPGCSAVDNQFQPVASSRRLSISARSPQSGDTIGREPAELVQISPSFLRILRRLG